MTQTPEVMDWSVAMDDVDSHVYTIDRSISKYYIICMIMDSILAQSVDRVIDDFSREVGWQLVGRLTTLQVS